MTSELQRIFLTQLVAFAVEYGNLAVEVVFKVFFIYKYIKII
jgi:hypothetical protein